MPASGTDADQLDGLSVHAGAQQSGLEAVGERLPATELAEDSAYFLSIPHVQNARTAPARRYALTRR